MLQGLCSTGPWQLQLGPWLADREGDADLRDDNGIAAHFRDEFVGRLIDDGKSPVVAGDHRLELKEALAGERRRLGPHGEAVADRHDADLRPVDLIDEAHVGEDRRVAHMVNGLALARGDDEAGAGTEINRATLEEHAGGMPGRHEGKVEILVMLHAAGIGGVDLLHTAMSGAAVSLQISTVLPV